MDDAGGDVEGLFSMEFKKYVQEQNLLCSVRTDWVITTQKYWLFENKNEPYYTDATPACRRPALEMTRFYGIEFPQKLLIQFWKAEQVANSANDFGDRRFQLTIRNQLFILNNFSLEKPISDELCSYRMKMHDVIITGDGSSGPISRVFMNKRMEFTSNIAYYSYEEYPHRDLALSCLIKNSFIFPLSDSYGHTFGVLEIVSQSDWPLFFVDKFLSIFPESGMMYLDRCKGLCGQYDLDKDSLRRAVSEIQMNIQVVCASFDIVFGQTWMLCKHCNSLSTSQKCAKELSASYEQRFSFDFGSYCILRESEGIVGRAAMSSHNLVYCENVAKFSITEYPLATFVRERDLSASFAICLQSTHSGDQVYVLEIFLGPSYVNWGLRKKLVPILDKMRQNFRTFKIAYGGEELGDNLSVLIVDASSPDKVETLKNESIDLNLAIDVQNAEAFNLPYYLQHSIGESSSKETDDLMIGVETSFQDISMDDVPVASASTVQSEINVTVKANYKGDFVRFQHFASSGIHELYRQVSQRLELMEGTYAISYRDEDNDLILLTCDEDLQFYISSSTEQGNYTLLVSIEPKCASPM